MMLIRNLDTKKDLVIGTCMIVQKLQTFCAENIQDYSTLCHEFHKLQSDNHFSFMIKQIHFSVLMSYAITINKSQGQTLTKVRIFSHGMAYVALLEQEQWILLVYESPIKVLLTFLQKMDGLKILYSLKSFVAKMQCIRF